jgi:uncharacterized protein
VSKSQSATPSHRPDKLDVRQFARDQATLNGQSSLNDFERLREDAFGLGPADLAALSVTWQARGIWHEIRGGAAQTRLHLQAAVDLPLQCQRCLEPVQERLSVDREFLFVVDEATAMKVDDGSELDVLAASKTFNLLELIEDELLMALPLVAMHDQCTPPLPLMPDGPRNPFEALKGLKRG